MAARPNPKILTGPEERALNLDLQVRFFLQRTMAANSMPVIALEFNVWESVIHLITHDRYSPETSRTLAPDVIAEIKRRRSIWQLTHERMKDYTMKALAKKYGVCVATIRNRVRDVRAASQSEHLWREVA